MPECKFWQAGRCTKGAQCRFRHGDNEAGASGGGEAAARRGADEQGTAEAGDETCVVCMVSPATNALLPCGHQCLCPDHAEMIRARGDTCPICRTPVTSHVKIYKAGRAE